MNINKLVFSISAGIAYAIPAVCAAESGVYASLRQAIVFSDSGMPESVANDTSLVDQGSRFGFQGNQELGSYSGFGRAEFGFDGGVQNSRPELRLGYVGLSGSFGTISVGSQWSAWDTYIGGGHTNFVDEGSWHNGPARNSKMVKYSGVVGGVSIETDLVFASNDGVENQGVLDEVQVALGYGYGSFTVQAAIVQRDDGVNGYKGGGNLYGARVTHDAGQLTVSLAVAQDDENFGSSDTTIAAANEETAGVELRASYVAGSNTYLAVATAADNKVAANTPQAVALGYQHDLSKRSRVSLELSSVDPDIAGLDASIEGGVMYRHDW